MKVIELIEKLSKIDEEKEIKYVSSDGNLFDESWSIDDVIETSHSSDDSKNSCFLIGE